MKVHVKTSFDASKIAKGVGDANAPVLRKIGAAIRLRALKLLGRKTGTIARPGEPPHTHEGSLKRLLFYAYDPSTKTEVIGPEAFSSHELIKHHYVEEGDVPHALEFGRKDREIHPFMGPAFQQTLDAGEIPAAWSGSVRG